METVDLAPDDFRTVETILRKHLPLHEVWAFGSRVRRTARPFSDLDLAILTEQPLSLAVLADLREAFSESNLPMKVDIVDWSAITPAFRDLIAKDHVVFQAPAASHENPKPANPPPSGQT